MTKNYVFRPETGVCTGCVQRVQIWPPPGSKKGSILTLFETLCNMFNQRENINFDQKKDPCLQKFEKMCKFCQNFWQFLTIFANFFFKKNKKIKIFSKKLFFFGTTYRKISSVHLEIFCRHTYIYILKNYQKKS